MSTMIFQKNLPLWERTLRTCIGLALAIGALLMPTEPWLKWVLVASGVSFVAMGFVGFCPMCAMFGRKLKS